MPRGYMLVFADLQNVSRILILQPNAQTKETSSGSLISDPARLSISTLTSLSAVGEWDGFKYFIIHYFRAR